MTYAYTFRIGSLVFILAAQYSTIGFCYPRLFVRYPDSSCANYDLYLGCVFDMRESDWVSWLDGTEIELDTIEEIQKVAKEYGVNWDELEEAVFADYLNALKMEADE